MDSECVDLVVTSPPYDNLRTYNGNIEQWSFKKFQEIAKELYRIVKVGGVIVWVVADGTVNSSETGTSFRQALYFIECGFNLHDTMIWYKPNCFNFGSNNCYRQSYEYMFILSKGTPKTINLIKDVKSQNFGKIYNSVNRRDGKRTETPNGFCVSEYKKRDNVWFINVSSDNNGHPAVFPLQLAQDHIISWSNVGDTVLDCFMGSGTTGVACKNLDRNFIGIELDTGYFNIAEDRMNRTSTRHKLF